MKLRFVSMAVLAGILLFFTSAGFCQNTVSMSEWVQKVGQGSVNWSAGYIEAVGIAAPPERMRGNPAARPATLRAATVLAQRNLLEITKGVQIDSSTTVRDMTLESDVVTSQVSGLVKGAVMVSHQYMSDGTAEVTLRMPLYGELSRIVVPEMRKEVVPPVSVPAPATPPPAAPVPAVTAPAAPVAYTGLVIDARGMQARPAMSPRIYDEDGKEVYGSANVDREYAVQQGMSGYARDLTAAQSNQRVTANPVTVKALKTGGHGKTDLVISNADAKQIRASAENASFMKKCRVMIVLD